MIQIIIIGIKCDERKQHDAYACLAKEKERIAFKKNIVKFNCWYDVDDE